MLVELILCVVLAAVSILVLWQIVCACYSTHKRKQIERIMHELQSFDRQVEEKIDR